jgi:D-alanine-D-alanine ligase
MKRKLRVGILFGGQSAEHEISLISARNIAAAIDRRKYQIVAIAIDKRGHWFLDERASFLSGGESEVKLNRSLSAVAVVPGEPGKPLVRISPSRAVTSVDVVFPVLHGPFGEDGTVQGLLKLTHVPFVGAGVLGSAVGMDKDVMKRLLRDANIPLAEFLVFEKHSAKQIDFAGVKRTLGLPVFVKPANLGSSVGISKVNNRQQFAPALTEAFRYDNKILVEENIGGREIECSVLGNDQPIASLPGEITTAHNFYSYEAKYVDESGARLLIPAPLPSRLVKTIQELAVKTFKVLCCAGMGRVDFFLRNDREIFVNEINTIPGFTKISMYPKLWEASGISYSDLIDRLIRLALERSRQEKNLRSSV